MVAPSVSLATCLSSLILLGCIPLPHQLVKSHQQVILYWVPWGYPCDPFPHSTYFDGTSLKQFQGQGLWSQWTDEETGSGWGGGWPTGGPTATAQRSSQDWHSDDFHSPAPSAQ